MLFTQIGLAITFSTNYVNPVNIEYYMSRKTYTPLHADILIADVIINLICYISLFFTTTYVQILQPYNIVQKYLVLYKNKKN